jgi:outer membrane protein
MKKLMLFAAVAVFVLSNVNAQDSDSNGGQTSKGKWVFGSDASISFNSTTIKEEFDGNELNGKTTVSALTVTPNAGYFVIDNLSIGLDLSFTSSKDKYDYEGNTEEYKSSSFGIIPNATYYFTNGNIAPYIGAGAGLLSTKAGDEDSGKFSGLVIKARGGVAIFLSNSFSVNVGVDFLTGKLSNKEESSYKVKPTSIGAGVGFAVYL